MVKEDTQEGVVKEGVKEEISGPVSKPTSTETTATSEKSEEWKRMMQSRVDKAEAQARKVTEELQALRREREQQRLEARQKEIEALADEPDEQAKVRRKHQLEDEVLRLEEQKIQQEGAVAKKYDKALELANKYNLGLADARDLMNAETPREMELLAQLKVAEQAKGQSPEKTATTGFTPDSGTSDAGGDDDETFMKDYSEGKSDDHARAKKVLEKLK